jgi:hypothetical protein
LSKLWLVMKATSNGDGKKLTKLKLFNLKRKFCKKKPQDRSIVQPNSYRVQLRSTYMKKKRTMNVVTRHDVCIVNYWNYKTPFFLIQTNLDIGFFSISRG